MTKNSQWVLASATLIVVVFMPAGLPETIISAGTQANNAEIIVLEGLKGVSVEVVQPVSGFEDKPKFNPVKVDELHATVEELLTEAGIKIVGSPSDDAEIGHVVVTMNVWKGRLSIDFIVQVKTELYQRATLVRDTGVEILTRTWPLGEEALEAQPPVIVSRHEIAQTVRHEMETQVRMLVGDYFEANPVPEPKPDISGTMTGTIRFVEEGCYIIAADNGVMYRPTNLPRRYRQHGLRVAFRAARKKGVSGIPCPGIFVELTRIVML